MASLPQVQPTYILRGHAAQIHSTLFIAANSRIVTGDADGWIVVWSLLTKRATAVWRAHEAAILGCAEWGSKKLITHGKDNKLIVWKFSADDEATMNTILPVEDAITLRTQPWLLHVLNVNTLNFCPFAYCKSQGIVDVSEKGSLMPSKDVEEILVAVPNTMSSEAVDIFHLPSEKRLYTVSGDKAVNTGMVMAIALFYQNESLTLAVGYESGHTSVSQLIDGQGWCFLYMSHPHSQPILSLDTSPDLSFYLTSSADAIIAKHPIPNLVDSEATNPAASPNLNSRARIATKGASLLSLEFAGSSMSKGKGSAPKHIDVKSTPLKISQTKHSGQQSLKIRSDGKIFATAGWDSKVRVYSCQTLKELAVLKWHKEGCYSVAFADALDSGKENGQAVPERVSTQESEGRELVIKPQITMTVKEKRILQATGTHWLAAGSKDGKVSLWDVY